MDHINLPHDHGQHIAETLEHMPSADTFRYTSEVFKQLADRTRLRIFWVLCHCEACVINVSSIMEMSSPAVSHHLRQLKTAGLVQCRRVGKEVYYRADTENPMVHYLHNMIKQFLHQKEIDGEGED